jgi:hypothetical protein
MDQNEKREEKARLDRHEFDLDTEEQERLRKERDGTIVQVDSNRDHSMQDTSTTICTIVLCVR